MSWRAGSSREQVPALVHTFLGRFFENEITGGTDDLKESFFWLVAFLAVPGVFAAVAMSWSWGLIARIYGPDALRVASGSDKVFYLAMAMIAAGILTSIVWHSLLVDRRDALVLGALPVSHRVVVQAKLLAVVTYLALLAVAMHAFSSMAFGAFLSAERDFAFAGRGVVAHFVASALASVFVSLVAIAAQGTVLAVLGPRTFMRVSPLLQLLLVTTAVLGLIGLPAICAAVTESIQRTGDAQRPWVLWTPPLWFFGIYETVLGTDNPILFRLARTAWIAFGGALLLAAVTYPLAYRRVMRDGVEHPEGGAVAVASVSRWIPTILARGGVTRGTAQFVLATCARVERHRLAITLGAGVALAWAMPVLLRWQAITGRWSPADRRLVLALPFATMAFMLVALRVAISLPGDLHCRWLFHATPSPQRRVRSAVRRVMLVTVVLPLAAIGGLTAGSLWSRRIGLEHAALCLALGSLMIESFVWGLDTMPCAAPWRPEHASLRTRWAGYLAVFLVLCGSSPVSLASAELVSFEAPPWPAVLVGLFVAAAAMVHWASLRRTAIPQEEELEPVTGATVLDLS